MDIRTQLKHLIVLDSYGLNLNCIYSKAKTLCCDAFNRNQMRIQKGNWQNNLVVYVSFCHFRHNRGFKSWLKHEGIFFSKFKTIT